MVDVVNCSGAWRLSSSMSRYRHIMGMTAKAMYELSELEHNPKVPERAEGDVQRSACYEFRDRSGFCGATP